MKNYRALRGIYLVIDPSMNREELYKKLALALKEGVAIVQIWDNLHEVSDKGDLITNLCNFCHGHNVPVLINNAWELVDQFELDGVHLDAIPDNISIIKRSLPDNSLIGLTCGNDLADLVWAEQNALDYVSFCSVFPSSTSNSCELISFDTIREARKITSIPIFLAGGISLENVKKLQDLDFDGIAVVSGIMNSPDPAETTKHYLQSLN